VENLNSKIEELINIAQKLGFSVNFDNSKPWNFSKCSFYPSRKITIYTQNFKEDIYGFGVIPDKAIELTLAHEIGHILVKFSLFPDMDISEFCFSNDSHFKIINEAYAWKNALREKILTVSELEYIQESINEYVFCEYVGTCIIEEYMKLEQSIISEISKNHGKLIKED
jgi:hypothetical protein